MKLQINTDAKTITIDQSVSLGELYELLHSMFPNYTWKDYILIPEKEIHFWKDPITIPWNPQPWINPPYYPLVSPGTTTPNPMPWITTCGTSSMVADGTSVTTSYNAHATPTSGTYNLIINKK